LIFKNKQKIDGAIWCARLKKTMNFELTGKFDVQTLGEIAEIALSQDHNELAIKYAD
tara:strand:+ start:307 stop:477 length:171 start_codon:yes stop_codon:yes gene_type:complete